MSLLRKHGFSRLTIDAIVARTKVSKATIYRRWSTKEELAVAAFDLLPMISVPELGNLEDEAIYYIDQYFGFLYTTPISDVLPMLVSEASHNKKLAEHLHRIITRRQSPGIAIFRRAIQRGELPAAIDPNLAHELIIGPMLYRSFFEPDRLNVNDEIRTLVKTIIAGLKANAAPSTSRPA